MSTSLSDRCLSGGFFELRSLHWIFFAALTFFASLVGRLFGGNRPGTKKEFLEVYFRTHAAQILTGLRESVDESADDLRAFHDRSACRANVR